MEKRTTIAVTKETRKKARKLASILTGEREQRVTIAEAVDQAMNLTLNAYTRKRERDRPSSSF